MVSKQIDLTLWRNCNWQAKEKMQNSEEAKE
jgi:hypothetical protein